MKRNKDKRIFAIILIRFIICTVVFSIPLWVFADRYVLLIEAVTGSGSFYDIGTVIVTNLVLAFVITLIFMLRAARLLDREYDGKFKFSVASLLNGMSEENLECFKRQGISLYYLVKADHSTYGDRAETFKGD